MAHSRRERSGEPVWQTHVIDGLPGTSEPRRRRRYAADETLADGRIALVVVLALAVLGAALGPLWSAWSGAQQRAYVVAPGQLYPFDEVETRAAADGRFLAIVAGVGLLAGLVAWLFRAAHRGPLVLVALGVGGVAGSALTWWTGYLTGGGTYHGAPRTVIHRLPLTLHMPGLLFVEPAVAILLYGLFVAFAAHDDLGRPDPVRQRLLVRAHDQPQYGWRDGDGAGPLQQRDLPPQ